ncbi:MAG: YerC/YecD family TrpR-related protein [Pseudomarimonas sp.]
MKRRPSDPIPTATDTLAPLCNALATLGSSSEVRAFLADLCTPAEVEAMADRWRVVPLLLEGLPYREIHDLTGVSVTTVGRVARCLSFGSGGYRLAADRLHESHPSPQ